MKRAQLLTTIGLALGLLACQQEQVKLDCADQADRGIDVLSGPGLNTFEGESFLFLSNEYGGRGTVEESVTSYPVFLNWQDGCQDEYNVNVLNFYHADRIWVDWTRVDAPDRALMSTAYALPAGESAVMDIYLEASGVAISHPVLVDTVVISGIPTGAQLWTSPRSVQDYFTNISNGTVTILFPFPEGSLRFVYMAYREAGTNNFRAVLIDRLEGRQHYDLALDGESATLREIEVGEEIGSIWIHSILNIEAREIISTNVQVITDGIAEVLLPEQSEGYLIHTNSTHEYYSLRRRGFYPEFPTEILVDESWSIPVTNFRWEDRDIRFSLARSSYFRLYSRNLDPVGTSSFGGRTLRGALRAGDHRLRMPDFPPQFKNRYPDV